MKFNTKTKSSHLYEEIETIAIVINQRLEPIHVIYSSEMNEQIVFPTITYIESQTKALLNCICVFC